MIGLLLALAWAGPCATSCAAPGAQEAVVPAPDVVEALVQAVAHEPRGEPSEALDALIFHADHVLDQVAAHPGRPQWLVDELGRRSARGTFRLVGPDGVELASTQVVLRSGEKQHLVLTTADGTAIDVNGRMVRVGAHHLWARF